MSKIIAIFNQKGGVGKTTTNVNLASSLGLLGKKILAVDIDPQGNTTSGLGIDKQSLKRSIYNVLIDKIEVETAIIQTPFKNLDLLPSTVELAGRNRANIQFAKGTGLKKQHYKNKG